VTGGRFERSFGGEWGGGYGWYRRGTCGKAGQEGKGSRTSTTHIELDCALESENAVSAQSQHDQR
jgi:hypothetical protein